MFQLFPLTKREFGGIVLSDYNFQLVVKIGWIMSIARKSIYKEAILRVIRGTSSHPTADWIYEEVRKDIPKISFGTVYSQLRTLKSTGEILELDLSGNPSRFDGKVDNHYHFRCERCSRVYDVDEPLDTAINERVARKIGLRITHHVSEFRGICSDCDH